MINILYAFLILFGVSLILGFGLYIASKVFEVKEDPRIKEVAKMLPNYNCGACGYAGCAEMAENLVSGKEKTITKCKPGKKDKNFDPILAYLASHPTPESAEGEQSEA